MTVDSKAMEVKKTQQPQTTTAAPAASTFSLHRLAEYIAEVKSEFFKITWTSKDELIVYTQIVVIATFLMGIAVFFTDVIIRSALALLGNIVHFIFG